MTNIDTAEKSVSTNSDSTELKKNKLKKVDFPCKLALLILVIIILGLAGALVYLLQGYPNKEVPAGKDNSKDTITNELVDNVDPETDDIPVVEEDKEVANLSGDNVEVGGKSWNSWQGEYLSASLPEGWSINEDGSVYIGIGSYKDKVKGFPGFTIINDSGVSVFNLLPIPYIGWGACACTEFLMFDDSDPTKYEEFVEYIKLKETVDMCGENYAVVRKVLFGDYSEFKFLDLTVRRVDGGYYMDRFDSDSYFDVGCYTLTSMVMTDIKTQKTLDFSYGDSSSKDNRYILTAGDLKIVSDADRADYEIADAILETIRIENEVDWSKY